MSTNWIIPRGDLPLATSLGWGTSISLSHGTSGSGEGGADGADSSLLGEDSAEHFGGIDDGEVGNGSGFMDWICR